MGQHPNDLYDTFSTFFATREHRSSTIHQVNDTSSLGIHQCFCTSLILMCSVALELRVVFLPLCRPSSPFTSKVNAQKQHVAMREINEDLYYVE